MSCQSTPTSRDDYQYSHAETATVRIHPSSRTADDGKAPPWSLNARVSIESSSTLRSPSPLFRRRAGDDGSWTLSGGALASGTPFSRGTLELLSRYPLRRLLVRVGDAAASRWSGDLGGGAAAVDARQSLREERAGGPSGTSVLASFARPAAGPRSRVDGEEVKQHHRDLYASLLRYLVDNSLFPPCGAPLDSARVRKHGHATIVRSSRDVMNNSTIQTVNVESFLAADGAAFCNPGTRLFLLDNGKGSGWGAAAENGACRSSWGLFGSLFHSSSGTTLSELLLGASSDAAPWESGGRGGGTDGRNSVWVDLQISPLCFETSDKSGGGEGCAVMVTRGTSYHVALPPPTRGRNYDAQLNVSLGDLLLGRETLQKSLSMEKEGRMAWYPCPLSISSRIAMYLPKGFAAALSHGVKTIDDRSDGGVGMAEFDVLTWKDGYIDLSAPWAQLHRTNQKDTRGEYATATASSLFGISRTVQRPRGVSSSGTLVTVLRYDQLKSFEMGPSRVVEVVSLDVLPGALIKPRMRTLQMTLYQGGGAGGDGFVPPLDAFDRLCKCPYNVTDAFERSQSDDARPDQCGLICHKKVHLSELQHHNVILQSDGSMLLERTIQLPPDSSLWTTIGFDEAYLPFQKFPADANRGVDAFPSRATFTPLTSSSSSISTPSVTLYSPSLLLMPPVPDMSMPFNVISLSCTLWALVLGSLLNILVRRGTESVRRELTGEKEKRPLEKLKDKIKEKVGKLKDKLRWVKERFGKKILNQSASQSAES